MHCGVYITEQNEASFFKAKYCKFAEIKDWKTREFGLSNLIWNNLDWKVS